MVMDLAMIGLGAVGFAMLAAYAYACARLQAGAMLFDYILGGGVSLAIFGYLIYALISPEKF